MNKETLETLVEKESQKSSITSKDRSLYGSNYDSF